MPFNKTIIKHLLFALIFFLGLPSLQAQKNSIKLGIFGLTYGRTNLNYERKLGKNKAINVQVGLQTPRKFPSGINTFVLNRDWDIVAGKWRANGITIDFRFYRKQRKTSHGGFYLAPFLSYNYNKLILVGTYNDSNNGVIPTNYKIHLHNLSIGVKIGHHWILNEHLSIDISFFGLGIGALFTDSILKVTGSSKNYQELAQEMEQQLDFGGLTNYGAARFEGTSDHIKVTTSRPLPDIKFSCSMGYAF